MRNENEKRKIPENKLVLVNKDNPVPVDFVPEGLVVIEGVAVVNEGMKLNEHCLAAYKKLYLDALAKGREIFVTSAYRSYEYQAMLFERAVKREGSAHLANMETARPGESEHHTGLAIDVTTASMHYELSEIFGDTPEGRWLAENSYKYGFIIRYPKGKENITGYNYEPWHLRYVGKEAAKGIWAKGITLEEYKGQLANLKNMERILKFSLKRCYYYCKIKHYIF